MPVYSFLCEPCNLGKDAYVPLTTSPLLSCEGCGKEMEKVWSLGTEHRAASAFPYVTRNLDPSGKPVEVRSASHLESLCKQYGVTHRPDAAWVTKHYEGYDWRTGKQRYSESSGVGEKGCWI